MAGMFTYYVLDADNNISETNKAMWLRGMGVKYTNARKVLKTDKINYQKIVTYFVGKVRTADIEDAPLIFKTQIYGNNNLTIYMDYYATYDNAIQGHNDAIKWVLNGCKD